MAQETLGWSIPDIKEGRVSELRAFTAACSSPWAILPPSLQQILEISCREHLPDFEAVAAKRARRVDGTDTMMIREGGVAILPVIGPVFRYANLFTEFSGGATISTLARDFNAALVDPNVSAILLNIDSPGGEVAGIGEFAQMVFEGRKKKPIYAYVDSLGASAAYWIASAAEEIVADNSAMIGSIGVVAAVPNPATKSVREIEFVSSQSPKKRPNPMTESGKSQIQGLVDDLADVFVSTVARNRGVRVQTVLEKFGQGDVLVGSRAVKAGLADRLGSFESLVAEMGSAEFGAKWKKKRMAAIAAEEEEMADRNFLTRLKEWVKAEEGGSQEEHVDAVQPEQEGPDLTAVTAENESLKKRLAEERRARLESEARAFVDGQVKARKLLPAEADGAITDYLQAAEDDTINPLADGNTRVNRIRTRIEAQHSHKLTEELVVNVDHKVLSSDPSGDSKTVKSERRKELLEQTSVGKAALKAVK